MIRFRIVLVAISVVAGVAAFTPISWQHHHRLTALLHPISPTAPFAQQTHLFATRRVDDFDDDDGYDENGEYDAAKLRRDLQELEQSMKREKYKGRATRAVGPGRAGGRRRKQKPSFPSITNRNDNKSPWNNVLIRAGIPLLALVLLVRTFFGSDGGTTPSSSPSYYYYQSSYYESRVYNSNGNMERTYKQSIKSNMPSLIESRARLLNQQQQQRDNDATTPAQTSTTGSSRNLLRESPNQELDEALVRVQQAMFSDWY